LIWERQQPRNILLFGRRFSDAHGVAYANQELNDFNVLDRWEIRPEVEKAPREDVRSDWSERDVEELVDDVLDEWDDDAD
jgi:hypothetical protein